MSLENPSRKIEKNPSIKEFKGDLAKIAKAIEAENKEITKINNSWLSKEDRDSAKKKHEQRISELTKNQNQLKTVSGVVGLFDRKNYQLVRKSAEPDGKAEIVTDTNGCYYLSCHGTEKIITLENGEEKVTHWVVDHEGNLVDTNTYIFKLIEQRRIPPNSTLRVASCFVSALDISLNYPNGVKVEKITEDPGEVTDTHFSGDEPNNDQNVVLMSSSKLVA